MRLIDADALLSTEKILDTNIIQKSKEATFVLGQVLFDIANAPTVDAVPMVDCEGGLCTHPKLQIDETPPTQKDRSCSYGERKGGTE